MATMAAAATTLGWLTTTQEAALASRSYPSLSPLLVSAFSRSKKFAHGATIVVHEQPEDVHGGDGNNKERLTVLQLQTLNCIPFSRPGKTNYSDKQKRLFASFYVQWRC
jgi:hypothetical protein